MSRPFADVSFAKDRRLNSRNPVEVLIRQREYRHDVAVVTINYETKTARKYAHGMPVTIEWGWLPNEVERFHGYVHHTEQVHKQQQHNVLKVYCVGASYPMKQIRLRSFKKMKAHQIAAKIAREHHFSLTAMRHNFVHDHLTQHGRSDWDFLVWLAKRCGMTFYVNRTDVVFTKRVVDKTPSKARPTFRLSPGRYRQRNAIYEIKHRVGDNIPGTGRADFSVAGVNDFGQVVKRKVRDEPCKTDRRKLERPIFGKHLRHPANTHKEAKQLLAGEADLHRFQHIANATISGSPRVRQGGTIRLTNLDEDSDGFWYVGMVDHHITRTDYRCHVELGRDTLGDITPEEEVPESDSGKPLLISDCDIGIDTGAEPVPDTIYMGIDDCLPVEEEVAEEQEDNPLDEQDTTKNRGRARKLKKRKKRRPCRCGCKKTSHPATKGKATPKKPVRKKKPVKLSGWRAKTTRARVLR